MSWIEDYFQGMALDVWTDSRSPEENAEEAAFVEDVLDLAEGAHVLDVGCGTGRLANLIGQHGYKVSGVDLSEPALAKARSTAPGNAEVEFIQGDIRNIAFDTKFDAAYCMGNSFGYYNHSDTVRFLLAVCASLNPGGKFVLDTGLAAETFLTVGGQKEWVQVGDIYMLMDNHYDCKESRLDSTFVFIRNGVEERKQSQHWIYTSGEICRMCEAAGFDIDNLYSTLDCEPFAPGSERLLLVATKRD